MLKLDSLYIYIGGVSPPPPPTATNHRCYPSQGAWARPRTLRPRTLRPRTLRPRTLRPRTLRPRTLRPRTLRPRTLRPLGPHPRALRLRALRLRALRPRALRLSALRPRALRPRALRLRALRLRALRLRALRLRAGAYAYAPYAYAPYAYAPYAYAPYAYAPYAHAPYANAPCALSLSLTPTRPTHQHAGQLRARTHNTERAKLVTRSTKTGLWPTTPRQNLTTHSAGVQRPLVIGGVVVPLYPHAFDQASCQTRLGFSPKGGNRRTDPQNGGQRLHNAVSGGSGGGVAIGLSGLKWLASPGPLRRWPPGTPPKPAFPGDASPQVRSLPQERLLEMLPSQVGCFRVRSARPRFP